jgi:broad specificity phosphatase PhoE
VLHRLHLVRHGEVHNPGHLVYADLPGFGLSRQGHWEAQAVADHLGEHPIDVVAVSPLQRAIETAAPLVAVLELDPEIDERLTEWGLLRRWAGIVWEDLPAGFPGEVEAYLTHPEDLPFSPEPLEALAARMLAVAEDLGTRYPGRAGVIVGHQDPVQALRLALTGRPLSHLPRDKPAHGTVVTLEPGDPWREISRWDPAA